VRSRGGVIQTFRFPHARLCALPCCLPRWSLQIGRRGQVRFGDCEQINVCATRFEIYHLASGSCIWELDLITRR